MVKDLVKSAVCEGNEENLSRCISSIKATVPEYELIVSEKSYNEGIKEAESNGNYFLLSSSTVLMDNSFFYLLLGLYSKENIGVIGGLTNIANGQSSEQSIELNTTDEDEIKIFASHINSPMKNAYEKKVYLSKYAILIKRDVIENVWTI
ncbi:hypothetical protein SAMN02910275_00310 [Butyrivibrio sp. INlla18]|uniref:hypothetical protein n=1 Tax=Butyrivibrio sp. INlla18 TaxID=1520806 RepID=UPI000890AF61|nr:hypothetical protein [Butyrivibrio sp. INlla18]SDA41945.1 hypothetical protein SAMN02910275_00310 [Butyrivibrio sp. INlla18]